MWRALCEHPAGALVNGSLPNLPAGYVNLDFSIVPPVFGDVGGNGSADAAVVVGCSEGGVNWPDNILVYRPDRSLLGMTDLSAVSPAEHSSVGGTDEADPDSDGSSSTDGDLGLAKPIRNLPCGQQFIVLAASSVSAGSYAGDISAGLAQFPGSEYLLTSARCTSLTERTGSGEDIYAVYLGPYNSKVEACAHATEDEVRFLNGDAPTTAIPLKC